MAPRAAAREAAGATYDLIVVGAGINGAGIARDAALRGLRVLLLDKGDIGGGTTSWSTRLIHGGLRYLEHREVGLVRESLRERERLLRLAPHLVKPLPLLIPIYQGDQRGRGLIRLGMVAYDLLSFDKSLDRHRMLGPAEALVRAPGLAPEGLRGAAVYYDAQVEYAERLAVENVLAARGRGATVLTHARVERLVVEDGAVAGVAFVDLLGGDDEELTARAPVVVNVAGPWVDRVLAGAGTTVPRLIGGTKGAHIVVGPFPGAPADALYVEAKRDGRPYFVVPWNGQFLIGTTDSRYEGDVDRVEVSDDEVDYLLAETNRVLPGAGLGRGDVHYAYAGIRPLPYRADGAEGAITRRHLIHDHAAAGLPGLLSIVGGKLTTFRELAEQTVDAIYRRLGRPAQPSTTARVPLPGADVPDGGLDGLHARLVASGVATTTADHLLRVYGARSVAVVDIAAADPDLAEPFDPISGAIGAEVVFAFRAESAETLADALLRRTMVGLGPDVGIGADEAAAAIGCRHLGWDDARAATEVEAYRAFVARYRPRALASVATMGRR